MKNLNNKYKKQYNKKINKITILIIAITTIIIQKIYVNNIIKYKYNQIKQ